MPYQSPPYSPNITAWAKPMWQAWVCVWGVFFPLFAAADMGLQAGVFTKDTLRFYLRPEYFIWEEYADAAGTRLLQETGARVRVGFNFASQQMTRLGDPTNWNIDVSVFNGTVQYDGATMAGIPLTTSTEYNGANATLSSEIRIADSQKLAADFILSVMGDIWSRQIVSTANATGYTENYTIVTATGGVRILPALNSKKQIAVELGLRYPIYTQEDVSVVNITLNPTPAFGYYGKLDLANLVPFKQRSVGLALTYDLIRFDQSPPAYGYIQPMSKMQLIGLQINF
ncbi:MAG: hypothetical protein AABY83_09520 [Pseudomonadota bacterium]